MPTSCRLPAGGRRIRTAGPPLRRGAFLNRLLPPLQLAKPVETEVFDPRGTGGSNPSSSGSQSVLTGSFHGCRRKGPAFAGSVSLEETREWDALGHKQARLGCFSLTGI